MNIDINIQIPYSTRPIMSSRVKPAFRICPSDVIIEQKQKELDKYGDLLYGTTHEAVTEQLVRRAAEHCGKPSTNDIVKLAMCFEEDIAIIHNGRLSAVCFCFPSGWCPSDKIGLTLAEIHQPVADNEHLVKMSQRIAATISDGVLGRFQRQVWTVTNNKDLSNFPESGPPWDPGSFKELYFRWEDQTTEPLGDGKTSLFFVAVNVVPLQQVWGTLGQKILSSINSMTPAVLKYKNLETVKTILNNF